LGRVKMITGSRASRCGMGLSVICFNVTCDRNALQWTNQWLTANFLF